MRLATQPPAAAAPANAAALSSTRRRAGRTSVRRSARCSFFMTDSSRPTDWIRPCCSRAQACSWAGSAARQAAQAA
ncbi:hypothetical protein G6F64_015267 [Rhizopus arrhizus]|uniref:Uncharacterized protein n=1 Tax=Rhizopus oryzae TaxID=64495 RepID=A0A9P6WRW3_RHIOR|nr:hypothetical protein G6F64_015267 [Rhizopus arrhizus]